GVGRIHPIAIGRVDTAAIRRIHPIAVSRIHPIAISRIDTVAIRGIHAIAIGRIDTIAISRVVTVAALRCRFGGLAGDCSDVFVRQTLLSPFFLTHVYLRVLASFRPNLVNAQYPGSRRDMHAIGAARQSDG
ncbi:MAG TPA: hypothetical protein VEB69_08910, partial [Acidimicrobiia bacterium]|nr:hypothetical protein [Acidimicrobiia bacterium]